MSGDESKHLQDDNYHYNMDVTGDEKMVERILSGKELSFILFALSLSKVSLNSKQTLKSTTTWKSLG